MLAREYAGDKKKRFKPVIISHHMLMGLKEGQEKMSKSDPDSAIFMEDSAADVTRKIKKAYCPPEVKAKQDAHAVDTYLLTIIPILSCCALSNLPPRMLLDFREESYHGLREAHCHRILRKDRD